MSERVKLLIETVFLYGEADEEQMVFYTEADLEVGDNYYTYYFDESGILQVDVPVMGMVTISDRIIRKTSSELLDYSMSFEKGKTEEISYHTPIGPITMMTKTTDIVIDIEDGYGTATALYEVSFDRRNFMKNKYTIRVDRL